MSIEHVGAKFNLNKDSTAESERNHGSVTNSIKGILKAASEVLEENVRDSRKQGDVEKCNAAHVTHILSGGQHFVCLPLSRK